MHEQIFSFFFILIMTSSFSQDLQKQELDEVVISSTKLDIPFSKNFRVFK